MAYKKTPITRLEEMHIFLRDHFNEDFKSITEAICIEIGTSVSNWYKLIKKPERFSPAHKSAIARIYRVPITFLFPKIE